MTIVADEATPLQAVLPSCQICGRSGTETKVLRFNLMVAAQLADGRRTTRGAGRIHLCERCWRAANHEADQFGRRRPRVARRAA